MKGRGFTVLITLTTLIALTPACRGGEPAKQDAPATGGSAGATTQAPFTEADLDQFERGFRAEIAAVQAAQKEAASATDVEQRGKAILAQNEEVTAPAGAKAAGMSEARYAEVRAAVNEVFTTLDFQGKIDGPLSIDLDRASAAMKARVSRDAFANLPAQSAAALRARMDRLVPLWIEYEKMVAVAG
jgi:hypothetical protein